MLILVAILIMAGSVCAVLSRRIATDFFCIHMLYAACLSSLLYLAERSEKTLFVSAVLVLMSIIWQMTSNLLMVMRDENSR